MYFENILIVNRGEIALRIIKTAQRLGIKTFVLFIPIEEKTDYVLAADVSILFDTNELQQEFTDKGKIISIAKEYNIEAIHPGYGFLAEDYMFAQECFNANIKFIGPSSDNIRVMTNRITASNLIKQLNIPDLKIFSGTKQEIFAEAENFEYPVILKNIDNIKSEFIDTIYDYSQLEEALNFAKGNSSDSLFVEQYIAKARHIEIQIMADNEANAIHLFDRECTIQNKQEKIITEAPSHSISDNLREKLISKALSIVEELSYTNAGTVEFLIDEKNDFYFLEMSTSLKPEYAISELITGIDIIEQQIRIAYGENLNLQQQNIAVKAFAIGTRIYAEAELNNDISAFANIDYYREPKNKCNIRIDSSIGMSSRSLNLYQPLLAKLMVWSGNRKDAITLLGSNLSNFIVKGTDTNIIYLKAITLCSKYISNNVNTLFCVENKDLLNAICLHENKIDNVDYFLIALVLFEFKERKKFLRRILSVFSFEYYFKFRLKVIFEGENYSIYIKNKKTIIINKRKIEIKKFLKSQTIMKIKFDKYSESYEIIKTSTHQRIIISNNKKMVLSII